MRWTFALPLLLLLSACEAKTPAAPAPAPAVKAAAVVTDFSGDIDARGTEPFWALKIRGKQLTLTRQEQPDLVAVAPGAAIQPGTGTWEGKSADGAVLKVTLYVSPCSDGMSDLRYPLSAEVDAPGITYSGCAAKTAQMPRAGG